MEQVNEVRFEQTCARLQQAGIAKVSFQTYWYSDEGTIDEEQCFDKNEQKMAWPESLSHDDLWELIQQGEEQFGRFELYTLQKRLVRLGVARPVVAEDMDEYEKVDCFDGGRDTEAIDGVYTMLQKAAIYTLTLKSYRHWGLHEIVAVHCFDAQEREVPLPEGLSESDLRVVVEEAPKCFGCLKLLVNERRWLFLGAVNGAELGVDDSDPSIFDGGEGEEVDV